MPTDWSVVVLAGMDPGDGAVGDPDDADDGVDPVPQLESTAPAIRAAAIPAMPIRARSGRFKDGPPGGCGSS
jgi:hypothetical protein